MRVRPASPALSVGVLAVCRGASSRGWVGLEGAVYGPVRAWCPLSRGVGGWGSLAVLSLCAVLCALGGLGL